MDACVTASGRLDFAMVTYMILLLLLSVASAELYPVHRHSLEHKRMAAWKRTACGSPASNPPSDIITSWGAGVTPDNVHPEYPRAQLVRGAVCPGPPPASQWLNMNGLWEFQLGAASDPVPFGVTLNQTILVPFPLEACLSGAFAWPLYSSTFFYRTLFDNPFASPSLLHFGAVDWNVTVYLNGKAVGTHSGGYAGFTLDLGTTLKATGNELILQVYDPSDHGFQVNGKQRVSAISHPGGDTYTPSSGVWQTVWLEAVPPTYVADLRVRGDMQNIYLTVASSSGSGSVAGKVLYQGAQAATFSGAAGTEIVVPIANAALWHPTTPNLYDVQVTLTTSGGISDTVNSYVGMRSVGKARVSVGGGPSVLRPVLNGGFTFFSGFLDQSWWPDGEYTAPTDDALKFDLQIVKDLGMNMIRLHQKVNPQRWYWFADTLGIVVLQDMIQLVGPPMMPTPPPPPPPLTNLAFPRAPLF